MDGNYRADDRKIRYDTRKISHKRNILISWDTGVFVDWISHIQFAFVRGKTDMAAVDASAVVFALYALGCGQYSFHLLCKG